MTEFVQNPRRSPRAPARCRTAVISARGSFEATTEDVGGHGCQLVSPCLVRKGEPIQLVLAHEVMKDPLRVAGRVAWASDRAPWRLGIAYDEAALEDSRAWFEELLSRVPGLAAFKRIPDRISLDATVYLATPPRFLVDFTADEVAVLRSLGSGTSVAELRALLRERWPQGQRALFSLLAHQHVTLTRGASVHPDAWRKALSEAESSLAVESLRTAPLAGATAPPLHEPPRPVASRPAAPAGVPPPPPAPPSPMAHGGPSPVPALQTAPPAAQPSPQVEPDAGPPDWLVAASELVPPSTWPVPAAAPAARGPGRGGDEGVPWSVAPPPLTGGASLPRPVSPSRSPEAQGCYDRALVELAAGRMIGAAALLRRAMALAPEDAEIAGAMERVSKRG